MQINRIGLFLALGALVAATPALAQQQGQRAAQKRQQQEQEEQKRLMALKRFPVGATWTLIDINGRRAPVNATLWLDSSYRATGSAGCNTFSATMYPAPRAQVLLAGPVALTKRACAPAIMQFERTYLSGVFSRPQWDNAGDMLTLKTTVGVMRFRRGI